MGDGEPPFGARVRSAVTEMAGSRAGTPPFTDPKVEPTCPVTPLLISRSPIYSFTIPKASHRWPIMRR